MMTEATDPPKVGSDTWVRCCQRLVRDAGGPAQVEQIAAVARDDPEALTHAEIKAVAALAWLRTQGVPVRVH